jgi:hypothetical protein
MVRRDSSAGGDERGATLSFAFQNGVGTLGACLPSCHWALGSLGRGADLPGVANARDIR